MMVPVDFECLLCWVGILHFLAGSVKLLMEITIHNEVFRVDLGLMVDSDSHLSASTIILNHRAILTLIDIIV